MCCYVNPLTSRTMQLLCYTFIRLSFDVKMKLEGFEWNFKREFCLQSTSIFNIFNANSNQLCHTVLYFDFLCDNVWYHIDYSHCVYLSSQFSEQKQKMISYSNYCKCVIKTSNLGNLCSLIFEELYCCIKDIVDRFICENKFGCPYFWISQNLDLKME